MAGEPMAGIDRRSLVATAAAAMASPGLAFERAAPMVTVRDGRLRGEADSGVDIFKGIPYGAPTAGHRFEPPRPPAGWTGVRPATRFGPASPQPAIDEAVSEDCLYLNIWTPAGDRGARRPVLVYIHGGAYSSGSGSSPLTDGARLARRHDVVVVTLNHRLSAFGYAYLARIGGAAFADSGNAGMLDLVQALRWVRDNIAVFGGDPGCVTLFGQSGGGAKIATLMAMPAAAGLFHRAITMSGQQLTASGPLNATRRAEALLAALDLPPERAGDLRTLPLERIVAALRTTDPIIGTGSLYFGPVLDERSLTRHPFYPDAPPLSARIPMIIGNTHDETRSLIGGSDPSAFTLGWDELPARLARHMRVDIRPETVIAEYRRLYPAYTPSELFFAATTASRSWRAAIVEAELRAAQGAPTWAYQLNWRAPADGGKWRAPHTLDIPLAFGTLGAAGSITGTGAEARAVSDTLGDAFVSFARTGEAPWPRYSLPRRATWIVDTKPRIENDPRGAERRLFEKVPFIQQGS